MREFIYKLFRLEYERDHCENCERLMLLLEDEKRRHDKLINNLLTPDVKITTNDLPADWQPKPSRHTPWAVTRQKLEEADKLKAEELRTATAVRDAKKKIEALEKETGIPSFEQEVEKANA